MIILNGKYNFAKVMLPDYQYEGDNDYVHLDTATKEQIVSFLNHPAFAKRKIVIMPDTHFGKGSCVGFTMDLGEYIIPNIIGVDIGCGIMATKLPINLMSEKDILDLDEFVKSEIPVGFNIHPKPIDWYVDELDLEFACKELNLNLDKVLNSVGTLGGGNHFIEVGRDEYGYYWLTIHSGSRNLGLQVANHFQKIADDSCKLYFQDFGELNFIPAQHGVGNYSGYIDYMHMAQHYANINRRTMTRIIMEGFFGTTNFEEQIDSVHNFISPDDNIIRKGATSARAGEKLVIPFNMRDGLIIAEGLGNPDWNNSAPHGAGRILSRNKAKEELNLDEAIQEMKNAGVYTTSLSQESLDEAAGAYKEKQLILDMISDTVRVTNFVKPIYNRKDNTKPQKRRKND